MRWSRADLDPAFARPVAGFCEDLDVDCGKLAGRRLVDGRDDLLDMFGFWGGLTHPNFTVKVPEIGAFSELLLPFAFEVFPNVCLDLFDDTRWLVGRRDEWKLLLHGPSLCSQGPDLSSREISWEVGGWLLAKSKKFYCGLQIYGVY